MNYYAVGVSSTKYHGAEALTYASAEKIPVGGVVEVPLRDDQSLGVVLGAAKPLPNGRAKQITTIYPSVSLYKAQLELCAWLQAYYPAPISSVIQLFLPSKVVEVEASTIKQHKPANLPPLTTEQSKAIATLTATSSMTALLHGDTGTGKTRVYIELARQNLATGRSVMILVPEIGLTSQMIQTLTDQFGDQVRNIHSGMTPKDRRETWRLIHDSTAPQIVIGPRSALFMPVRDIGLIVVDEAHDTGYKQDQQPYYEATRVAAKLASLSKALCLYGTATPRLADYWHLAEHGTPIVRLAEQINPDIKQPIIQLIDTRDRQNFNRSTMFSEPMLEALSNTLSSQEQSLVFLNRRGTARFVSCSACGWFAACDTCDTPLTYHGDAHQLQCHTCGHKQAVPPNCPVCDSAELRYQRRGTKALQSELEKAFPEARIARFDSDNTKDQALASQYATLAKGDVDIIIGTQVIAKGLDLDKLSLVCIPQADLSSYLPDFTADEQTFQLLCQVIGRVGRRNKPSQVVIQTFQPNSPIIQAATTNNWSEFYQQHLLHRKKYNFPPFSYLLQVTTLKASAASARKAGEALRDNLQQQTDIEVLGPAPRFHEKVQGKYQWQLVIKSKSRARLLQIIKVLPSGWRYNIDPTNLL